MAANFGFVVNAAQAQPDEFAVDRARYRTAQTGLAHARRPDQTENRTFRFFFDLADGQSFDDSLLDLFESVMILVQNFLRFFQIEVFF
ncbi:MAG: hypothetical protein JMDDDDMK_00267 [Acidobacteria bacterium]|nr:hypothetical protein [Acidobacteriota bacterium]